MKRGDLARATGCNLETIRYYENVGVMPPPRRAENGYRVYAEEDRRRLSFVMRGRELGFSLEEIKGLLALLDTDSVTCEEVFRRTERHLESVRQKIRDLKRLERILSATAAQCSGDQVPECPVIDALAGDNHAALEAKQ